MSESKRDLFEAYLKDIPPENRDVVRAALLRKGYIRMGILAGMIVLECVLLPRYGMNGGLAAVPIAALVAIVLHRTAGI